MKDYEAEYTNGNTPGTFANNGGTITNRLAGTRNFSVEAEWKAAARQGGEASVTYQLQYQDSQGNWQPVETPMVDADGNMLKLKKDGNGASVTDEHGNPVYEITEDRNEAVKVSTITITDFKAETMKKTGLFGPVDEFDEDGNKIVYRVVQTDVARNDGISDGNGGTVTNHYTQQVSQTLPENSPMKINDDEYNITVTPDPGDNTSDRYKFLYQLTGEIDLKIIEKVWDDTSNQNLTATTHDSDVIQAVVERMNFSTNQFVTYTHDDDNEKSQMGC